ncbi:MAG: phosphotransferase [Rikenellaceae bacterium]
MNRYYQKLNNKKHQYIIFSNAQGKSWIVPLKNMRTALNLYQPSSLSGKLIKRLLPYLHRVPIVRRMARAHYLQIKLRDEVKELLCEVLNLSDFEYSLFSGTPSVHQKVTIQISQGEKIIAYCKLAENPEIVNLFEQEETLLKQLHKKGVEHIPTCLYCGRVTQNNDTEAFVESTIKTNHSHIVHSWSEQHWQFLKELHQHTKASIPFAQSEFAQSLITLEGYLDCLPKADQKIVSKAIERVRKFYGNKEVEFSAFHGDFTPWNMFIEDGELFVFDLEYAGRSYPPYIDWFHYFTQVGLLVEGYTDDRLWAFCKKQIQVEKENFSNIYLAYTQYLLAILSLYLHITHGTLNIEGISYKSWIGLLARLNGRSVD